MNFSSNLYTDCFVFTAGRLHAAFRASSIRNRVLRLTHWPIPYRRPNQRQAEPTHRRRRSRRQPEVINLVDDEEEIVSPSPPAFIAPSSLEEAAPSYPTLIGPLPIAPSSPPPTETPPSPSPIINGSPQPLAETPPIAPPSPIMDEDDFEREIDNFLSSEGASSGYVSDEDDILRLLM